MGRRRANAIPATKYERHIRGTIVACGFLLPFSTAFAEDRKMNASDVMVRDVVTIRPDDEISTAVRLLADHGH